jgi:Na+/proline symporter
MLYALLLGALFVIAFTFFFGVRSYAKQMTMTALLAGSIGLFIGLVVVLSTPYTGPVQVSRDAWNFVIDVNHMRDHAK